MVVAQPERATAAVSLRECGEECDELVLSRGGRRRIGPGRRIGECRQDADAAQAESQEPGVSVGPHRIRSEVRGRAWLDLLPIDDLSGLPDLAFLHRVGHRAAPPNVGRRVTRHHPEEGAIAARWINRGRGRRRIAWRLARATVAGRIQRIVVVLIGSAVAILVGQWAIAYRNRAARGRRGAVALVKVDLIGESLTRRVRSAGGRIGDPPPVLAVVGVLLARHPRVWGDPDHAAVEPRRLVDEIRLQFRAQVLADRAGPTLRVPSELGDEDFGRAKPRGRHLAPQPAEQRDVPVGIEVV